MSDGYESRRQDMANPRKVTNEIPPALLERLKRLGVKTRGANHLPEEALVEALEHLEGERQ